MYGCPTGLLCGHCRVRKRAYQLDDMKPRFCLLGKHLKISWVSELFIKSVTALTDPMGDTPSHRC